MKLLPLYTDHIKLCLTASQIQTLKILIWLLTVQKTVKIERLSACFPLPIRYESRRKHIQRFLTQSALSLPLFWFPIIKLIIEKEFLWGSRLILTIDRTQWKNNNIFLIAVIYKKRALPIYWQVLNKKGSSNLAEQQAIIKPVLRLLKQYELVILGDREFHGVELSYWLKTQKSPQKIYFIFRQKQGTNLRKPKREYQKLSSLGIKPGHQLFLKNINITKNKGFGYFNLAGYWKRKYNKKVEPEPWYLLTNLDNCQEVIKLYRSRMGIEAMFKDCKTGGYNLEGSQANTQRLTNLILLIALAYTTSVLKGKSIKNSGHQKYIARLTEARRTSRRHSNFWLGIYGELWIIAWEFLINVVRDMMNLNRQKMPHYQRGIKAISLIKLG
ncbi:transposase IS4 family protein (plasmid) [Stanieria cyanosphaera PCC 7437]|uniref:Transposase IS4 family protein n=1 Tax=Stanieria cyanosphaera (strain ATCC 29371 / PCC 7437) TaxID=111780 RepID=K9Y1N5_STAC7|nr:IS4 family transposase [Stanieria cyanosphaera]AFZ38321.1 transposase IS4 family protein [Stanieria cyanosphaera PCC 7437]